MTTMFIDTKFLHDPRVARLARALGWHVNDALVALLRVWAVCYERSLPELSVADVDTAAERDGFAAALVRDADLAVAVENGVYLAGAFRVLDPSADEREKIEILERARARTGARTRAGVRTSVRAPARSSSSSTQVDLVPTEEEEEQGARKVKRSEYKPATDAFQARFEAAYHVKPKWGGREINHIKALIRSHGANEVIRRINVMFDNPPKWMTSALDMATFVHHFDKFAAVIDSSRGKSGLSYGRVEPQNAESMDPRPPWEIK